MHLMTNEDARIIARQLLRQLSITQPPVDLIRIAEFFRADIYVAPLPESIFGHTIPLSKRMKKTININYIIIISTQQSEGRKIFTLAHEIAHIALAHANHIVRYYSFSNSNAQVKNHIERLCDIFATELLMPKAWVVRYANMYRNNIDKLTEIFMVSRKAMEIRLTEIK